MSFLVQSLSVCLLTLSLVVCIVCSPALPPQSNIQKQLQIVTLENNARKDAAIRLVKLLKEGDKSAVFLAKYKEIVAECIKVGDRKCMQRVEVYELFKAYKSVKSVIRYFTVKAVELVNDGKVKESQILLKKVGKLEIETKDLLKKLALIKYKYKSI